MMIGDGRLISKKDDSFLTVELERLSSEKVIDIYRKCGAKGFGVRLKPYLVHGLAETKEELSISCRYVCFDG